MSDEIQFESLAHVWRYWREAMNKRDKAIRATVDVLMFLIEHPGPTTEDMATLQRLDTQQQEAVSTWDEQQWERFDD